MSTNGQNEFNYHDFNSYATARLTQVTILSEKDRHSKETPSFDTLIVYKMNDRLHDLNVSNMQTINEIAGDIQCGKIGDTILNTMGDMVLNQMRAFGDDTDKITFRKGNPDWLNVEFLLDDKVVGRAYCTIDGKPEYGSELLPGVVNEKAEYSEKWRVDNLDYFANWKMFDELDSFSKEALQEENAFADAVNNISTEPTTAHDANI